MPDEVNPNDVNPFARPNQHGRQVGRHADLAENPNHFSSQQSTSIRSFWLIAAVVLGLFFMGLVCCGGVVYFSVRAGTEMVAQPVNAAIAYVSADEEIVNRLGLPIVSTSTLSVSKFKYENGTGDAQVGFNAKGPNGTARVDGTLTLADETWRVEKLNVRFSDGTIVTLPRTNEPSGIPDQIQQEETREEENS